MRLLLRLAAAIAFIAITLPGLSAYARAAKSKAVDSPPQPCLQAIGAAERAQHTPERLMRAIGLVESGRPDPRTGVVEPWPWTINAEGIGHFFDSKAEAIQAVEALQARGVRSIDVGCMQVNLMHHPTAFASLDEAFDPQANAAYAARFLRALFREFLTWPRATAAYHSQTADLGNDYARKVMAVWGHPFIPFMLMPSDQAKYFTQSYLAAFATNGERYRAFAPQGMLFGAFADRASLPASLRGFGGIPATPAERRRVLR